MIKKSDLEIIEKFIRGTANPVEERYVQSLFADYKESFLLKNFMDSKWKEYLKEPATDQAELSHVLDRVHHIIHKREMKKEQNMVRKLYRWYSVAAAVLLIPLLIAGLVWIYGKGTAFQPVALEKVSCTLLAPLGSRIAFTLPDGTRGWLNSGSELQYSLPFSDNRQVAVSGEAWFEVARNEANSFEIDAGNSRIKVLGTNFNVNAYPEEDYLEVALVEGKVEFSSIGLKVPVVLKPDQRLIYRNNRVIVDSTDAIKYAAWVEGKLVFRGDPMPEVARRLERWYNVKVEIVDKDLENDVIRGTFQDDSLNEVLRLLCMTSPIRYKILDRKELADGTFEKGKVLLYKSKISNKSPSK